jgi:major membrane immunogen (membrane-anchored lipoprotein)
MSLIAVSAIPAALLYACAGKPASGTQASATPVAAGLSALSTSTSPLPSMSPTPGVRAYRDGAYEYKGRPDGEGYHVEGTMAVSHGDIASMQWKIVDATGRVFDGTYEEVYTGNEVYMQQCRDNFSGLQTFVPALLDTQDPLGVDTVSGATWAYNKFQEAAKALLEQANR